MHVTIGLICIWGCYFVASYQYPVVEIENGLVSGTLSKTWKGRTIYKFEGVPYAAPPVGELRFQEAQPKQPWLGVWNASAPGSQCIQYDHVSYSIRGDEDCLYVNVYTPKLPDKGKDNKLLNVLIFIHGGAFMFLDGSTYNGELILDKDLVFVTINYRLGPIGFFSTGDSVVSGNNGLKDQVQAFKWVKRNIKSFGGNPDDITISGMSAGGASVHYHMLSPLSRGLFQKAISQSGTAMCPWTITENVPVKSAAIGHFLGCPTHPSEELVNCLNTRPAKQIVEGVKIFFPFMYNPFSPFGPTVELPGENAFISELPYHTFARGLSADIPWLTSMTTHEGLYPGSEFVNDAKLMKHIDENWNQVIPHILDYNFTIRQENMNKVSELIRKEYIGNTKLVKGNTESFIQLLSDRLFVTDIVKTIKMYAKKYESPVYLYRFGYRGRHSISDIFSKSNEDLGSSHADDTAYALKTSFINVEESESDSSLASIMVEIWSSFVLKGIPSTGISSINWKPVSKCPFHSAISYLQINSAVDIHEEDDENMGRISFWDSLGLNENENYALNEDLVI